MVLCDGVHDSIAIYTVADSVMLVTSVFLAALMTPWEAGTVVVTLSGAATVPTCDGDGVHALSRIGGERQGDGYPSIPIAQT